MSVQEEGGACDEVWMGLQLIPHASAALCQWLSKAAALNSPHTRKWGSAEDENVSSENNEKDETTRRRGCASSCPRGDAYRNAESILVCWTSHRRVFCFPLPFPTVGGSPSQLGMSASPASPARVRGLFLGFVPLNACGGGDLPSPFFLPLVRASPSLEFKRTHPSERPSCNSEEEPSSGCEAALCLVGVGQLRPDRLCVVWWKSASHSGAFSSPPKEGAGRQKAEAAAAESLFTGGDAHSRCNPGFEGGWLCSFSLRSVWRLPSAFRAHLAKTLLGPLSRDAEMDGALSFAPLASSLREAKSRRSSSPRWVSAESGSATSEGLSAQPLLRIPDLSGDVPPSFGHCITWCVAESQGSVFLVVSTADGALSALHLNKSGASFPGVSASRARSGSKFLQKTPKAAFSESLFSLGGVETAESAFERRAPERLRVNVLKVPSPFSCGVDGGAGVSDGRRGGGCRKARTVVTALCSISSLMLGGATSRGDVLVWKIPKFELAAFLPSALPGPAVAAWRVLQVSGSQSAASFDCSCFLLGDACGSLFLVDASKALAQHDCCIPPSTASAAVNAFSKGSRTSSAAMQTAAFRRKAASELAAAASFDLSGLAESPVYVHYRAKAAGDNLSSLLGGVPRPSNWGGVFQLERHEDCPPRSVRKAAVDLLSDLLVCITNKGGFFVWKIQGGVLLSAGSLRPTPGGGVAGSFPPQSKLLPPVARLFVESQGILSSSPQMELTRWGCALGQLQLATSSCCCCCNKGGSAQLPQQTRRPGEPCFWKKDFRETNSLSDPRSASSVEFKSGCCAATPEKGLLSNVGEVNLPLFGCDATFLCSGEEEGEGPQASERRRLSLAVAFEQPLGEALDEEALQLGQDCATCACDSAQFELLVQCAVLMLPVAELLDSQQQPHHSPPQPFAAAAEGGLSAQALLLSALFAPFGLDAALDRALLSHFGFLQPSPLPLVAAVLGADAALGIPLPSLFLRGMVQDWIGEFLEAAGRVVAAAVCGACAALDFSRGQKDLPAEPTAEALQSALRQRASRAAAAAAADALFEGVTHEAAGASSSGGHCHATQAAKKQRLLLRLRCDGDGPNDAAAAALAVHGDKVACRVIKAAALASSPLKQCRVLARRPPSLNDAKESRAPTASLVEALDLAGFPLRGGGSGFFDLSGRVALCGGRGFKGQGPFVHTAHWERSLQKAARDVSRAFRACARTAASALSTTQMQERSQTEAAREGDASPDTRREGGGLWHLSLAVCALRLLEPTHRPASLSAAAQVAEARCFRRALGEAFSLDLDGWFTDRRLADKRGLKALPTLRALSLLDSPALHASPVLRARLCSAFSALLRGAWIPACAKESQLPPATRLRLAATFEMALLLALTQQQQSGRRWTCAPDDGGGVEDGTLLGCELSLFLLAAGCLQRTGAGGARALSGSWELLRAAVSLASEACLKAHVEAALRLLCSPAGWRGLVQLAAEAPSLAPPRGSSSLASVGGGGFRRASQRATEVTGRAFSKAAFADRPQDGLLCAASDVLQPSLLEASLVLLAHAAFLRPEVLRGTLLLGTLLATARLLLPSEWAWPMNLSLERRQRDSPRESLLCGGRLLACLQWGASTFAEWPLSTLSVCP